MDKVFVSRTKGILQTNEQEFVPLDDIVLKDGKETVADLINRIQTLEKENKELKTIVAKIANIVLNM